MPTQLSPQRIALALTGLLAITLAVYLRGLFGGFQFDDYPNIVENEFLLFADGSWQSWWDAAFSSGAGLLRRPVSMLSFAINAHFSGMDPVVFKLFNVLIHLASGLLAYRLALLLIPKLASRSARQDQARSLNAQIPALLAAAAWLLHPLQVSNVLYVVQRMNLLAAFFTLAALLCYASLRLRQQTVAGYQPLRMFGLAVFTALAVLSKENGALVPVFVLVIELFCFRFDAMRRHDALAVRWALLLVVVVPALLALAYAAYRHDWLLAGYAIRDFDLTDRLLTQARMLWHYLLWSLLPNPHWMGLYHDDIPYSTQLTAPWSTLPALLGLAGLLYAAWRFRQSRPGVSFAIAWFFAGHLLESTVLPLEMVFEHRQYLPLYGILLGLFASLEWPARWPRTAAMGASAALLLTLALLTAQRSWTWGDPVRLALATVQDHPNSPRSLYDAGRVLIEQKHTESEKPERLTLARDYLTRAMQLSPSYVHPAVTLAMTYQDVGIVPPPLLAEITERIRKTYFLSPLPELLLIRTAASGRLQISPEAMAAIVEATLANQSVDAMTRGLILSNYGNYLASYAKDPQAAIAVSLAAIEIEPRSALFQLNAAYLAERLGQAAIASQHLHNAELLDATGIYRIEIDTLRKKLESQATDGSVPQ